MEVLNKNQGPGTKLWHLKGGELVSVPNDEAHAGQYFLVTAPPMSQRHDAKSRSKWGDEEGRAVLYNVRNGFRMEMHTSTRVDVHKDGAIVLGAITGFVPDP